MKFFKQKIVFFFILSLFIAGCNLPANNDNQVVEPKVQNKPSSAKIEKTEESSSVDSEEVANSEYKNQKEKAMDAIREADIFSLRTDIDQYYGKNGEYPDSLQVIIDNNIYKSSLPKDPETDEMYIYNVFDDSEGGKNQCYRVAAVLLNIDNKIKMEKDGGVDPNLYEHITKHNCEYNDQIVEPEVQKKAPTSDIKKEEDVSDSDSKKFMLPAEKQARDTNRQADLMRLKSAVEYYYSDNEKYPETLQETIDSGHLKALLYDPDGSEYIYEVSDDGQECYFAAKLEATSNLDKMKDDGGKDDNLYEKKCY